MKKIVAGLAAIVALIGTPALAADMEFKVPPPAFSWTGFYVGAQAGGGAFDPLASLVADPGVGFLAGGQFGYNRQFGMFVLGVEGEGFWASMIDRYQESFGAPIGTETLTYKNTADFDVAVRAGLAIERALIYGKGGFVMSRVGFSDFETEPGVGSSAASAAGWLPGLLIGAGLQYAMPPAWNPMNGSLVVGLEYDYIALNTTTLNGTATCTGGISCVGFFGAGTGTFQIPATGTKQIVKLRFDWLFNGPQ